MLHIFDGIQIWFLILST